jgi:uncharacterized membrane protein YphA (DoxX/SURF4 family)
MRLVAVGHLLFAIGLTGVGVLSIASRDFAYTWQPVPPWVPGRGILAVVSGLLLLGAGIGMLLKRTAHASALVMTIYLATWVLVLQCPRVAGAPTIVVLWLGVAENLVLVCGGWSVFLSLDRSRSSPRFEFLSRPLILRILFGASCLVLGLSHFVYVDATAGMVPAWLPDHRFFAYLTGSGHFAAGIAILLGVVPRLAATLEAGMISIFVLLIHIPGAVSAPTSRLQWTMLFVASALAGSVWAVAGSLRASSESWSTSAPNRVHEVSAAEGS